MKKIIYLLAAILISATTLMAQPKEKKIDYSPETRAMMRLDRLTKEVSLTDKEKQEVLALFTKQEQERAQYNAKDEQNREKARQERQEMRKKNAKELKAIIGEERYNKYQEASKKEAHPRRAPQGDDRPHRAERPMDAPND